MSREAGRRLEKDVCRPTRPMLFGDPKGRRPAKPLCVIKGYKVLECYGFSGLP